MDINSTLIFFGEQVIKLEYLALLTLIFLSFHQARALFFGGEKDIKNESDSILHSCFITAACVAVFHVSNSYISQLVLNSGMEKIELRKMFYLTIFMMEFLFILSVFAWHKLRKCDFTIVARMAMLIGIFICLNIFIQFQFHAVGESDSYTLIYRVIVLVMNLTTLGLIFVYPSVAVFKRLVKTRKL